MILQTSGMTFFIQLCRNMLKEVRAKMDQRLKKTNNENYKNCFLQNDPLDTENL